MFAAPQNGSTCTRPPARNFPGSILPWIRQLRDAFPRCPDRPDRFLLVPSGLLGAGSSIAGRDKSDGFAGVFLLQYCPDFFEGIGTEEHDVVADLRGSNLHRLPASNSMALFFSKFDHNYLLCSHPSKAISPWLSRALEGNFQ